MNEIFVAAFFIQFNASIYFPHYSLECNYLANDTKTFDVVFWIYFLKPKMTLRFISNLLSCIIYILNNYVICK